MHRAIARLPEIPDPLPASIVAAESLGPYDLALRRIHFPEDPRELELARQRLKFDELFTLELGVAFRKQRVESTQTGVAHHAEGDLTRRFLEGLPFVLTVAQQRAVKEVGEDMAAPRPMNRLLQGDVGSGKTVVAVSALLVAVQGGHQGAFMAPTEVLAEQHHLGVRELLEGLTVGDDTLDVYREDAKVLLAELAQNQNAPGAAEALTALEGVVRDEGNFNLSDDAITAVLAAADAAIANQAASPPLMTLKAAIQQRL